MQYMITAIEAMNTIRGCTQYQTKAIEEFGLSRDDLIGHKWQDHRCGYVTINFIRNKTESGVEAIEAMNTIRGCTQHQIKAIEEFGLSRDDLIGHNWDDQQCGNATINFIRNKTESGVEAIEAMNTIRGCTQHQITAIEEFGLSRDDLIGHNWDDQQYGCGYATINFIRNKPSSFSYVDAFNMIKGKTAPEIYNLKTKVDLYKQGYKDQALYFNLLFNNRDVLFNDGNRAERLESGLQNKICQLAFRKTPSGF